MALGKEKSELLDVAHLQDEQKYRYPKTDVYKKDGTRRNIMTPVLELRSIQHRINQNIFKKSFSWPSYLFGSIPKSEVAETPQDYIEAAQIHCGAKTICSLDISDFFDNFIRKKFSTYSVDYVGTRKRLLMFLQS